MKNSESHTNTYRSHKCSLLRISNVWTGPGEICLCRVLKSRLSWLEKLSSYQPELQSFSSTLTSFCSIDLLREPNQPSCELEAAWSDADDTSIHSICFHSTFSELAPWSPKSILIWSLFLWTIFCLIIAEPWWTVRKACIQNRDFEKLCKGFTHMNQKVKINIGHPKIACTIK